MKDEDIIGKTFTCCEFATRPMVRYDAIYKALEGRESIVLNIHTEHPEYTQVHVTGKDGRKSKIHYPTEVVKQQIQERESRPIEHYFDEVKKILYNL
jgi:hypothetical protein